MAHGISVEHSLDGNKADSSFLLIVILLSGTGIAMLYSASFGYAQALGKTSDYFFVRQLAYLGLSAVAFLAASWVSIDFLRGKSALIVFVALLALILPFIPGLGVYRNGAIRWIGIGSRTFQPSEIFKPALVLYLAHLFSKKSDRIGDLINSTLPPLFVAAIGTLIIYWQNDFSTAVLVLLVAVIMFWIAEVPFRFFLAISTIALPLVALSVMTSDFRLKRIITYLKPEYAPESIGYQVLASLKAIRSGGFWGKGIGLGTVKLSSVPEVQCDFVFSAIVEETGFLGVLLFIALWVFLAWRAFGIAFRSQDRFVSLASYGLAWTICLQVVVNIAVTAGIVPATGISLPFFSAGGSSLLSCAIICGLLYNFSRRPGSAEALNG